MLLFFLHVGVRNDQYMWFMIKNELIACLLYIVVIWSHVLGGVQRREEPLPWGESDGCNGGTGTRGEDGTAKQCCLY